MSRFYAAIQNARALVPATGRLPAEPPGLPGAADASDLPVLRLWQAVESRLPGRRRKVVLIAACADGEADSGIALRLARLAGRIMGGGVVVLNSRPNPSGGDHGPVAFGPLPGGNGDLRALNPGLLASYWQLLLRAADLVILDAPPVLASPVCLGLAPTVDGVILLV